MYITDIEVDDGCKSDIFNFAQVDIFEGVSLTETTHFVLYHLAIQNLTQFSQYYSH